jgi:hypothetical protein
MHCYKSTIARKRKIEVLQLNLAGVIGRMKNQPRRMTVISTHELEMNIKV